MSQITFLLGAGISIPAKLPSTDEITTRVLSGEGFARHTDSRYWLNAKPFYTDDGKTCTYVSTVTRFLSILYGWAIIYFAVNGHAKPNYEDLYHMLDQICDEESKEREGPVVHAFLNQIGPQVDDVWRAIPTDRPQSPYIRKRLDLFVEAKTYVRCVVWRLLQREPCRLDHLRCLVDACRDDKLDRVTITTLNHDTILEECLKGNSLEFIDGFGENINGVRYWDHHRFDASTHRITLLKLHGSINWFRFQDQQGIPRVASFNGYPDDAHDGSQRLTTQDAHPFILVGTFNKEREYTEAALLDLHYQFLSSLRATNRLVVAGYGWADKGINMRVFGWMNSNPQNKIALIEPYFNDLVSRKAGHRAGRRFKEWQEKDRLSVIERGIECTGWSEIVSRFT